MSINSSELPSVFLAPLASAEPAVAAPASLCAATAKRKREALPPLALFSALGGQEPVTPLLVRSVALLPRTETLPKSEEGATPLPSERKRSRKPVCLSLVDTSTAAETEYLTSSITLLTPEKASREFDLAREALLSGDLTPAGQGKNGAFFLRSGGLSPVAVVKPKEHELGGSRSAYQKFDILCSKVGLAPEEGAPTECLAFLAASKYEGKFKVPTTVYGRVIAKGFVPGSTAFLERTAAIQQFIPGTTMFKDCSAERLSALSPSNVHHVGIFDIIFFNTDRNSSNLLVAEDGELWLIDNGCLLPRKITSESAGVFCWKQLPQTQAAFSEETKAFIRSLTPNSLQEALSCLSSIPELSEVTFRDRYTVHMLGVELLKQGAEKDLSLFEIASFCQAKDKYDTPLLGEILGQALADTSARPLEDKIKKAVSYTMEEYVKAKGLFLKKDSSLTSTTVCDQVITALKATI